MSADYMADVQAAKARNIAAATTLFDAHKDLREGAFGNVWIFADSPGYAPALTVEPMTSIP
jgi:branched-subunit amino acid aminotransferase/4-amino-4-deoxychorismate lyase